MLKNGGNVAHIMLVDDEENILNALRRALLTLFVEPDEVLRIETFTSPEAALKRAEESVFDLVVSDYRMPGMDGVTFLKRLSVLQPDIARLILSGYTDLDGLIGAINEAHIFRFLSKPWHDNEVYLAITQALQQRRLLMENQRLADEVRAQRGIISRHELELRRLEQENPGITQVNWGPNGEVIMDEDDC